MKFNDISVVILFYKTSYKVIKNLSNYKNFDIYILDQSNDIILKKKIEKKFPKIKYYGISSKNNGFAKGINFLVKKTDIFINTNQSLNPPLDYLPLR